MKVNIPPNNIVFIGSSAGGPRILKTIFTELPLLNCSIILIQHMPKFINESIRESLDEITEMDVIIPNDHEMLINGTVYIAPSELQCELINNQRIRLYEGEKVHHVSPSVDIAMLSARSSPSHLFTGIILTGMGNDGAEGIVHIKKIGGTTIAQNEETSIIFGMPKEAIDSGMVDFVLSPESIRNKLIQLFG